MNQPIPQFVSFVPTPVICNAVISKRVEGSPTYDVAIDRTPLGEFNGPIRATPIFQQGMRNEYKVGDRVKVLAIFHFDVNSNKFDSFAQTYQTHILGLYEPEALIDVNIQNPLSEKTDDRIVIRNEKSNAGITLSDNYEITETPGGAVSQTMKAFGLGVFKNCHYIRAQNYHRIISHNDPSYPSREHFGMFGGESLEDEATRVSEKDYYINYRRFVQQTRDPLRWVSTCEGAYAPWLGANNNSEKMSIGKEVLFTRIVNYDSSRITCEMGAPGEDFVTLRVDDVVAGELMIPTDSGASPGLIGNRFKVSISDKGAVEIYSSGKGIPAANFAGFKMKVSEEGELEILAAKKITISHGDADESLNSIVLDPSDGIKLTSMKGVTVNGKKLVNENFLSWMNQNSAAFTANAVVGVPGAINPIALPMFLLGLTMPDSLNGFYTAGLPVPATGIISQVDDFMTIG